MDVICQFHTLVDFTRREDPLELIGEEVEWGGVPSGLDSKERNPFVHFVPVHSVD
jgi:hypothetical protein